MPGTVVEAGAVVDKAIIGEDCIIHSGAVVHKKDGSVAVLGRHGEVTAAATSKGDA